MVIFLAELSFNVVLYVPGPGTLLSSLYLILYPILHDLDLD